MVYNIFYYGPDIKKGGLPAFLPANFMQKQTANMKNYFTSSKSTSVTS